MSRFNLLLISPDIHAGHLIVKAIYKVFKRNFVFEVESDEEALRLIEKLKIDLIVVDFDHFKGKFSKILDQNPDIPSIGIYTKMDVDLEFDPDRIQLISKAELYVAMLAEMKAIKKGSLGLSPQPSNVRYGTPSFRDYFTLATAK